MRTQGGSVLPYHPQKSSNPKNLFTKVKTVLLSKIKPESDVHHGQSTKRLLKQKEFLHFHTAKQIKAIECMFSRQTIK